MILVSLQVLSLALNSADETKSDAQKVGTFGRGVVADPCYDNAIATPLSNSRQLASKLLLKNQVVFKFNDTKFQMEKRIIFFLATFGSISPLPRLLLNFYMGTSSRVVLFYRCSNNKITQNPPVVTVVSVCFMTGIICWWTQFLFVVQYTLMNGYVIFNDPSSASSASASASVAVSRRRKYYNRSVLFLLGTRQRLE